MKNIDKSIENLKSEIRNCTACSDKFIHKPNPITRFKYTSRIIIISQAPGTRAHNSSIPWHDRSGDRLRDWLYLDREKFYDDSKIAIMPMGLCYPGVDKYGGDLPPVKKCAPIWHEKIRYFIPNIKLTLLIGSYAQKYYLKDRMKDSMTKTVYSWREYLPEYFVLPHPSWRNNSWINNNLWFTNELIPNLRETVHKILDE